MEREREKGVREERQGVALGGNCRLWLEGNMGNICGRDAVTAVVGPLL